MRLISLLQELLCRDSNTRSCLTCGVIETDVRWEIWVRHICEGFTLWRAWIDRIWRAREGPHVSICSSYPTSLPHIGLCCMSLFSIDLLMILFSQNSLLEWLPIILSSFLINSHSFWLPPLCANDSQTISPTNTLSLNSRTHFQLATIFTLKSQSPVKLNRLNLNSTFHTLISSLSSRFHS